jgi:hypothetical protein
MLESHGLCIAAVSYDSLETLRNFAEKYQIRFPLLSDRDSAVIARFGILNTNIAPGLRAHGVPHPVEYLVSPEGMIVRKYFVPNYRHRVAASAVVLREYGPREYGVAGEESPVVTIQRGAISVRIGLSANKAFAGQELGFFAAFTLEPGWHVYGAPLPEGYTTTSVTFDDPKILSQSFELPPATPVRNVILGETLPVHGGSFQGLGSLLLKFPLDAGKTMLSGQVRFQQCGETSCEMPETVRFRLPLTLEPFMVATPG